MHPTPGSGSGLLCVLSSSRQENPEVYRWCTRASQNTGYEQVFSA